MQLDPIAAEAGVRLLALTIVGSTNEEAIIRARKGERGPLWITAEAQTAGRGRRGRSWNSPPGNLYASLLLSDPAPLERAPELAFVAVVSLRDAIAAEAPALAPRLRFKWPNDLLIDGAKCAGILLEGEVDAGKRVTVVIGIGVNCAHHPPSEAAPAPDAAKTAPLRSLPFGDRALLFPATDLHAQGANVTAAQLFRRLSATTCERLSQWDRGRGFTAILGAWLSGARGIGEEIRVDNGRSEKIGRFVGLDPSGRLVLESRSGALEKISAGDVFPFAPAGGRKILRRQGR